MFNVLVTRSTLSCVCSDTTMELPPELIFEETDCVLGVEADRDSYNVVRLATLPGGLLAVAKVW